MQKKTLKIINKLGLHARAAMKLVDTASRYQAEVTMHVGDKKADAKDILQTMSLGAPQGTSIAFEIEGPDEEKSMADIEKLINAYFHESE